MAADDVTVEGGDRPAVLLEDRLADGPGDGGLARAGETGEEEDQAAVAVGLAHGVPGQGRRAGVEPGDLARRVGGDDLVVQGRVSGGLSRAERHGADPRRPEPTLGRGAGAQDRHPRNPCPR